MSEVPLQKLEQEIEILLSNDFDSMSLKELETTNKEIENVFSISRDQFNFDGLRLNESQRKSKEYLLFLIEKKEQEKVQIKEGDIFYSSWGYEQTNTEMFKVIGFTKSRKTAIIKQVYLKTVVGSEGLDCDRVIADSTKEYDLPALKVKIGKRSRWNPKTKKHEEIGEHNLRGSVYYGAGHDKHLTTLFKLNKGESAYRSWYA